MTTNMLPATRQRAPFHFDHEILRQFAEVEDNYVYHVRAFLDFAAVTTGDDVLDVVRQYFQSLNGSGLAASTIRSRRSAVKDRLRRATADMSETARAGLEHELSRLDRTVKCPSPPPPAGATKTLSPQEYEALIRGARSDRQRRFIEFLSMTGCRVSEMTGVRLADCRIESGYVSVLLRGKGSRKSGYRERVVFVSTILYSRIRETFNGNTWLFETAGARPYRREYVSRQLAKLTTDILGKRLSAHGFRHAAITRLLREGKPIDGVSRYVGHSSVEITLKVYSHNVLSPADILGPDAVAV